MKETINTYIKQSEAFLEKGNEIIPVEEALSAAGPDLRSALVSQRRRLKKRNLSVWIEEEGIEITETEWENRKLGVALIEGTNNVVDYFADGIQYVEYYEKYTKGIRRYILPNGQISEINRTFCREYYVKDKLGEEKEVLSVDIAGKIHGLYRRNTEFFPQERFPRKTSGEDSSLYFMMPFWGLLFSFMVCTFISMVVACTKTPSIFWYAPVVLGVLAVVAGLVLRQKHMNRRNASRKVVEHIRVRFDDFSIENFIAMAAGRLKCICYAEEMEELADFVNSDLTDFLVTHMDVVNCDQIDFFFREFVETDQWLYIEAEIPVLLDRDKKSHIEQQKETVKMKFIKPTESIMATDFYHDWYVTGVEV